MQGDNTPKELKNSYTSQICCLLSQANIFQTTGHHHLQVGHTHEDVDNALSLVTTCLRQERVLETPADVVRCLNNRLGPVFAKRNMQYEAEVLDEVVCLESYCLNFFLCCHVSAMACSPHCIENCLKYLATTPYGTLIKL